MSHQGFDDKVEVVTKFRTLAPCGCSKPVQTFALISGGIAITQRFRFEQVFGTLHLARNGIVESVENEHF
jgi:hypothetical protein